MRPDARYAMKRRLGLDREEVEAGNRLARLGVVGGVNLESLAQKK